MKMKILMSLLFLEVLSLQILQVNAQHPVFNLVKPPTENNNWVRANCINQDQYGFMWFGTRQGLHRFDGKNYISYYHDPEDSASISSNWINCLVISKSGKMWVGFYDGGLDCFDPVTQTFKHYKHNPEETLSLANNSVASLLEDKDGKLWVGTHGGLDLFHYRSAILVQIAVVHEKGK